MATVDSSTVSGAAAAALHDYRCATCGYGVAVARPPEFCPMCQSKVWEHAGQPQLRAGTGPSRPSLIETGALHPSGGTGSRGIT